MCNLWVAGKDDSKSQDLWNYLSVSIRDVNIFFSEIGFSKPKIQFFDYHFILALCIKF